MLLSLLTLAPLLTPTASAFCGNYVGPLGSDIKNEASQVILARNGTVTTLTMANDVIADVQEFGLLIPLPVVPAEEDIREADSAVFDALQGFSAPRLVSYTCADFAYEGDTDTDSDSDADTDDGEVGDPADGVTVEAEYSVGAYEIVVVSATGAEGLDHWLETNGFVLDDAAVPLLEEYIAAGSYFLAARVSLDDLPTAGSYLAPLQIRYDNPAFSLPIRLGAASSTGVQDLVIYALTTYDDGEVGISNYDSTSLEQGCMVPEGQAPEDYYTNALDEAFTRGFYLTEHSWATNGCDPCSSEPPSNEQLQAAGVSWDIDAYGSYLTRLHLRYTPEQATEDLMLYPTRMTSFTQTRYILYNEQMEDRFPVCGIGMVEDPGSCNEDTGTGTDTDGDTDSASATGDSARAAGDDSKEAESGCGCAAGGPATPLLALLVGLAQLTRLRRSSRARL